MAVSRSQIVAAPSKAEATPCDVALVAMPFTLLWMPSIGLALLQGALDGMGVPGKTFYFTLDFARRIGEPLYTRIVQRPVTQLTGEWLFSGAVFPQTDEEVKAYVDRVLPRAGGTINGRPVMNPVDDAFVAQLMAVRAQVDPFLDECVDTLLAHGPKIVGFTTVFQQNVASLALARRLKERSPETFVVFGGANCEGVMGEEVLRRFSFVDAVVSGEGDRVFPELVRGVLDGSGPPRVPGLFARHRAPAGGLPMLGAHGAAPAGPLNTQVVEEMDSLPYPNYDDYFRQVYWARHEVQVAPRMLYETSRGCWWGEKHHCTFCGLNGATMRHRSKSAARAMEELLFLVQRHPGVPVSVVDNILDMGYFRDFIPELAKRKLDVGLFYEVKANLTKDQVMQLRAAGVTYIQPGVESLSDAVLKIMRKGVRGLQNIQLLKWCKEAGVIPEWNYLWGFPGEPPEEYERLADVVPLLTHLEPPRGVASIRLDRFSPNFNEAEALGFTNVRPYPAYNHIYSGLPAEAVANLAYHFTFSYKTPQPVNTYTARLERELLRWQKIHAESDLLTIQKGDTLFIWDLRPVARRPLSTVSGLRRALYQACDRMHSAHQLSASVRDVDGRQVSEAEVEDVLAPLVEHGLMLREGNTYLSLAIPQGRYAPSQRIAKKMATLARGLGSQHDGRLVLPAHEFAV